MTKLAGQNEVLWEVLMETRAKLAATEARAAEREKEHADELENARRAASAPFAELEDFVTGEMGLPLETGVKALLAPGVVSVSDLMVQHCALLAPRSEFPVVPLGHTCFVLDEEEVAASPYEKMQQLVNDASNLGAPSEQQRQAGPVVT